MKIHTAKRQSFLKTVSFILAAAITFNILSMPALSGVSAESAGLFESSEGEDMTLLPELPDNADPEKMYIEQLFYGEGISLFKDYGRTALDGIRLEIYEFLRGEIEKVAAGDTTDTVFDYDFSTPYTDEDVFANDMSEILDCLLADLPQDFYWYDKTKTGGIKMSLRGYSTAEYTGCKFSFTVSKDYAAEDSDNNKEKYKVNTAKMNSAKTAVENAQKIAAEYADMSDYEKIMGYKNRICNLTEYNHEAADDNNNTPYGDPWQLVYVFDDDPDTNVVCEGYSKAFQYLCDLGGIECYTVTGTMDGGTGAGGHMWNIVVLGGKSYLVDITNCDGNSVGSPDLLLLKGADTSDSNGCIFNLSSTVSFTYDPEMLSLYPSGILTVSDEDYDPDNPGTDPVHKNHTICAGAENCPDDIHGNHNAETWTEWNDENALPDQPGYYYLSVNVTLTESWKPADGTSLCLNGHTISAQNTVSGIIFIRENRTFNLCDCAGKGKITGNKTSDPNFGGGVTNHGTFNMYSGEISGNTSIHFGGGVYNRKNFYMYGGKIDGNEVSTMGGGVCSRGEELVNIRSLFIMYGGEISGNTSDYGGGVTNAIGSLYIYGGKISENNTTGEYGGGGVLNGGSSEFYMYGGEITKNNAKVGGGVCAAQTSVLGGNAVINGNKSGVNDSNLYIGSGITVTLDTVKHLTENANIGITTQEKPADGVPVNITGKNDGNYSKFFHSDKSDYKIIDNENNVIQLVTLGTKEPHKHTACAGAENCPKYIHDNHNIEVWTEWNDENALPDQPGYYYLSVNVTLTASWKPADGTHLCFNGYKITPKKISADEYERLDRGIIYINTGYTFELCDCQGGGMICKNTAEKSRSGGGVTNNGIFNLYSGEINENTSPMEHDDGGGGVYNARQSIFNMYGGKITGNKSRDGAGVYNLGEFNIYGGIISGNAAKRNDGLASTGGGVLSDNTFNLRGGVISENTASQGSGVFSYKIMNMSAGEISGNTATMHGGGVFIATQYVASDGSKTPGTLNMYGGIITGNTAGITGGGVCAHYDLDGVVRLGGNAVIQENIPNNLYLNEPVTVDEITPLIGEACIGVSIAEAPDIGVPVNITGQNNGDYQEFFSSDDPAYEVINSKNNEVQLILPHDHSMKHIEEKKPTCTEPGNVEYYVCELCFRVFEDENGEKRLPDVPEDLSALGHLYGGWTITTEPTEEEDSIGEAKRICERDPSHIERVELKTLIGEMWTKIEDIPATCTEEGKRVYTNEYGTVTVILKKLSHDYEEEWQRNEEKHWQVCKNCGTKNPDSENPHNWDEGVITVEATTEHDGEKTYTCEVCGHTRTEKTPKLDPPVTLPSETEPPETPPSETEPPETPPSETEPPVTPPSETEPPVTPPSGTEPPVTPPSETEPPVTPPSETEPPVTPPSETEPPVTPPSETEPPVTPPSETEPPETPPSETRPPINTGHSDLFEVPETTTTVTEPVTSGTEAAIATIPEITTTPPEEIKQGSISKRVESPDYTAEMPDSLPMLANNVLTPQEMSMTDSGSIIEILLTIDKINTVSDADGAAVREVLNGFKMWQYLDINLYKVIDGTRYKLSGTNSPVTIRIDIPEALRELNREYAMVRVHDGTADILNDLDGNEDTVTFATDRFSVYVLVYKDAEQQKEIIEDIHLNTGVDSYTSVFLATGITALSASMTFTVMGTGIVGMSEERKNKVYDKLICWGKNGGKTKKTIALALIFLLLSYYYTLGTLAQEECKN